MELRDVLRELFKETMQRANLAEQMRERIRLDRPLLHLGDHEFDLSRFERVLILAVGKAAVPMSEFLIGTLAPLGNALRIEGVIVGGTLRQSHSKFDYWPGAHPLPDANSRGAAQTMLAKLAEAGPNTLVLFLVSGGASAMLEMPLDEHIGIEETAAFHRELVHSGLPIRTMNVLRKHFSAVKGGRLAAAARGCEQCTLLVSDVPEGLVDIIGSGPSLPDPSTVDDCRRIFRQTGLLTRLPRSVAQFFESPNLPETPKPDPQPGQQPAICLILSSTTLADGAAAYARSAGYHVEIDNSCDDWDYRDAAGYLFHRFELLRHKHRQLCLVSTGEVSVQISDTPGTGGRNQQFVLEMAHRFAGAGEKDIAVLSAGSDGIDGNSPAAGAVADATTWTRASDADCDPKFALQSFDAYPLFARLGEAIITGPTGNNIRDLRVLMGRR